MGISSFLQCQAPGKWSHKSYFHSWEQERVGWGIFFSTVNLATSVIGSRFELGGQRPII